MSAVIRSAGKLVGPIILILIIVLMAACGPAGGADDSSDSETGLSDEERTILNADGSAEQDKVPAPNVQVEDSSESADPVQEANDEGERL